MPVKKCTYVKALVNPTPDFYDSIIVTPPLGITGKKWGDYTAVGKGTGVINSATSTPGWPQQDGAAGGWHRRGGILLEVSAKFD